MLNQIIQITILNLLSLPQRLISSLVVVVGIAGVVGVLVSVLAMSGGLNDLLVSTGEGDRVIVLRDGATSEVGSFIPLSEMELVKTAPGIARFPDGRPQFSAELVWSSSQHRKRDDSRVDLTLRGLDLDVLEIRPGIKVIAGRAPEAGLQELMVGELTRLQYKGLDIGDTIRIGNSNWEVVGAFESGDILESGMITDRKILMSTFERTNVNAIRLVLEPGLSVAEFELMLDQHASLLVEVKTEEAYYSDAGGQVGNILGVVSGAIGMIMALGATFGALNTMYSAVSARSVEIATLRALGFGRVCVVVSVMTESLVLAMIGAAVGVILATSFFSGDLVSLGPTSYRLVIDLELIQTGIIWACLIGMIGGLFPAIHAARLPV